MSTKSRRASRASSPRVRTWILVGGWLVLTVGFVFLSLYDRETDTISFPYFVDQFDPKPEGQPPGRGMTAYVLLPMP